ncbi:MAG: hypothetical protein AAF501_09790 [Pseudomonadota bacterium]
MTEFYSGFGLLIASDIPLTGFSLASDATPDVSVFITDRARQAAKAAAPPPFRLARVRDDQWCFSIPDVADYLIIDGREIHVSPGKATHKGHLELFLAGSAIGVVLHQRGLHALHAATIAVDSVAIAFVGEQGAGKSTLAAAMARAGHRILGDDVIALYPETNAVLVYPGTSRFKLWQNSIDALGLSAGPQIGDRVEKFYVDAPKDTVTPAPCPLSAVVGLDHRSHGSDLSLVDLTQLDALNLISEHTYRAEWIDLIGGRQQHFEQCAAVSTRLPVWRLARPDGLGHLERTCRWLEVNWARLGAGA